MANAVAKTRLYSPSAIGNILRIARERACQEERRTKRYMAEALGITVERLSRIEAGTAQVPFELAVEWCHIVEDYTALAKIKHIYGMELPPTDPRLLKSVSDQLVNFIRQASDAIEAAKKLLYISTQLRPGDQISETLEADVLNHAEEILDTKQAAECVLDSMQRNWRLCRDTLNRNWIQEAIADRVIISSVAQYENIRKEIFFEERSRKF
ncbi:hypothetical protein PB1_16464 [Bacillus methanolicus PB1]|uniref:Uncharacterized protein n=1 Tax=Bacillus methanolicus PB1 TaxID=997296 RepID=I3DY47_BACMT|nr:helix-turn-helix transcriptional regulator [Bacillus methanolicus]EIJ79168.1 hypothetical protein PB1_16464 [Bacillus methanolicus PB1]